MARRIQLGFGTLKVKKVWELRRIEHHREVPVLQFGKWYFCWHARGKRHPGADT